MATPSRYDPLAATLPNFRFNRLLTYCTLIFSDLFVLSLSGVFGVWIRYLYKRDFVLLDYAPLAVVLPLFLLIFGLSGLYPGVALNPVDELRRVFGATTAGFLAIVAVTFLAKMIPYSRLALGVAWVLSVALVVPLRNIVRRVMSSKSWWGIPVVIFGAGSTSAMLIDLLLKNPQLGFRAALILDEDPGKHTLGTPTTPPVVGGLELASDLSRRFNLHYVVVAMPGMSTDNLSRILNTYAQQFPHFLLIPDLIGLTSFWVSAKDLGGVLGLEIQQNLMRPTPRAIKGFLDLVLVVVGGVSLLPLLLLLALSVKLTSRGPVFYSQFRVGRNGKRFLARKFRSMVPNADYLLQQHLERHPDSMREWSKDHKLRNDPRVTKIGKLLRKTSLDELPQLWNVFTGEMSLVGPRPIVEREVQKYGDRIHLYFKVKPGITGLWQVSGRNNTSFEDRVKFDEYYVRNWSVWMDLYILGRTIKTVLGAKGAY